MSMLPARIFRFACSRKGCRFEIREERRSRLSSAGILLNISSRSKASSSLGSCAAASSTVARRSRSSRAWALRWSSKEADREDAQGDDHENQYGDKS